MATDLFGAAIPDPPPSTDTDTPDRITNDIDEVVTVLRLAVGEGYVVVGAFGAYPKIWRCLTRSAVEPVPRHEADIVRQLLEAGWLTIGGSRAYMPPSQVDFAGRAVLVPKRSRQWLQRWDSRKRLGTPGGGRR